MKNRFKTRLPSTQFVYFAKNMKLIIYLFTFLLSILIFVTPVDADSLTEMDEPLCGNATMIDPSHFLLIENNVSFSKLLDAIWFEHVYWTNVPQELSEMLTGYVMMISGIGNEGDKTNNSMVNFQSAGKNGKQCISYQGSWQFPKIGDQVFNIKQKVFNQINESSVFLLDTNDENFLLKAMCYSGYFTSWNISKCDQWGVALLYRDLAQRTATEIHNIEHRLRHRLCYFGHDLKKYHSQPSNDCVVMFSSGNSIKIKTHQLYNAIFVLFMLFLLKPCTFV